MSKITIPDIRNNKYTIFTKSQCKYCDDIKVLMTQENEDVKYILCDEMLHANRDFFIEFMKEKTNKDRITFPIVFFDGEYVGGYDDYNEKVKERGGGIFIRKF